MLSDTALIWQWQVFIYVHVSEYHTCQITGRELSSLQSWINFSAISINQNHHVHTLYVQVLSGNGRSDLRKKSEAVMLLKLYSSFENHHQTIKRHRYEYQKIYFDLSSVMMNDFTIGVLSINSKLNLVHAFHSLWGRGMKEVQVFIQE